MSGSGNVTLSTREEDILKEYSSSLEDLTVNSKPLINMLTMLAEESIAFAHVIVLAIEKHLQKISSDIKLPVLYLIDSIMKNVGKPYPSLFTQNIVSTFCSVFEQVDEKTRAQMFKLRHTWNNMFPSKKMYALDARVHNIDPAWPITAPPTTSPSTLSRIHLNPKFFQGGAGGGGSGSAGGTSPQTVTTAATTTVTTPAVVSTPAKPTDEGTLSEAALRENLLKKKKELLELQQKKLELELLQTKKKLEEQEKQLEKTTVLLKPETKVPNTSNSNTSNSDVPVTTRRSSRSSSSSSSYSKSDSKRSSRSQRRAALEAAIAAANEANSLVINPLPNIPSTITNSSVTAGSVSGMSPKSKPCAPVAPVVTTAVPSFPPLPSGKVICPPELLNTGTTTVPVTSVKIAPVSSQLIKAARSRDPRLRSISNNEVASVTTPVPITVAPNVRASVTNRTPLSVTSVTANSITTPSTKNCLSNTNVPVATTSSTPISIVAPLPQTPPPPLPSSKIVPNRPISVPVTTIPLPTVKADAVTAVTKSNVNTPNVSFSVITSSASSVSNSVAVNKTETSLTDCLADKMKLPNLSSPPKSKIGSTDGIDNTKEGSKKVEIKNKVKMKKDKKLHRSKDGSKNNTSSINKIKKEKEKVSDDLFSIKEKDKTKYNKLKFNSISDDCPISITGDNVICYGKQKSKSKSDRKNENKDFIKLIEDKTFVKDFKTQSKLSEKVNLEGQFVLVVEAENIKNNETFDNKSDELNLEKLPIKSELEKSPKKSCKEKDGKKSPKSSSPRNKHSKSNKSQKSPVKSIHKIHEKSVISQDEKDDEVSSSPPPPVTSNEVSDKFKEVRASSIQRLKQCARHREPSVSPPPEPKDIPIPVDTDASSTTTPVIQSSSITSGDTDLRVPPVDEIKPPVVPAHESKKDIDLRALTAAGSTIPTASELLTQTTKRPSVEREPDLPPMKKSKMDKLDELFGREDTDMRQELAPPLPSPPPPPIISPLTEVDENSEERSWAKYKQGKPDVYKSLHRHPSRDESSFGPYRRKRDSLDRLGRPLLYHRSPHGSGGGNQYSRSGRHRHEQVYRDQDNARNHSHGNNRDLTYNYILREAEEQFKSGTVPISTYNRVVKEVITMNEQTKLDEAIRRDELQTNHWKRHHRDSMSPGSASAYERNSNLANSECNSEYDYQGAVDEDLESDVRKSESEIPEEDHDNKSGVNTGQIIKFESEYDPGEPIMTNNNEEESCPEEVKEESRIDVKESLSDIDLRTLHPSVDVSVDLKQHDSVKTDEFDEKPEDISDLKYEAVSSSEHSEEFDLCDDEKAGEAFIDEKPNITVKDEIEIEEHFIENKFDVKQENDVVVSSDVDARIIPSSLTENDSKMNLIPPPFPKEILKSLDDCNPNILGIPDPAIIASKDTDLRIGMRPIGAIGAVPINVSVSPKKCIPMETEFNENSNPDADMDVDNHCLRKSPVELPVRSHSDKLNDFDESSRGHSKQKKFPRYKDTDDYKQHKSPPQGSNFGSAPWDRQQGQQPQSQNIPTPGMVGPNPWMRPLLRPPPAMIIRAGMDSSRFNPRWPPNSSGPPPLMPPNFQQPLPSMQQIPPIRPPPPPPAGMFVESDMMGNVPFGPPRPFGGFPPIQPMDLAPADPAVLDSIMQDPMRTIIIDGVARDIRYYGDTAVVFMNFDDPREILFQGPPRHVTINDEDTVLLSFNAPFKDIVIDGQTHRVRFGGPTREFCINDSFYECFFGGPPITVDLGGDSLVKIQLEGPPPQVKIGNSRKDLVVGKINLIVDAKGVFPIYLDPKPQTFEIDGVPYILRFVNALETVVINGTAFTFEYGGLPQPIHARGKRHFLRFTSLPQNVKPGYVDIYSMEGCRRGSSPPCQPPTGMPSKDFNPLNQDAENSHDAISLTSFSNPVSPPTQELISDGPPITKHDTDSQSAVDTNIEQSKSPEQSQNQSNNINPLDIFATLMTPVVKPPTSGFSYSVEQPSVDSAVTTQPEGTTKTSESKPKDSIPFLGSGQINISELFQRLVASGIVPGSSKNSTTTTESTDEKSPATTESNTVIKPTDFHKPETLRVRQPGLISILFSGIQCSSCGVRFPPEQTIKYSQHLDWHFRQNRRDRDSSRKAQSRKWYYDVSDWIQFEEIEDLEERAQSWFESQAQQNLPVEDEASVDIPSVPCENGLMDVECEMCKDKFEQFYNEDKEEWHLRRAVKIDDKIYHPLCYEDYLTSLNAPAPELDETKPEEIEPAVETPYEDEDDDVIIQEIEPKPIIIELIKDDEEEEEEAALKAAEEAKKALEIPDEKDVDDESRLDIEDGAEKIDLNVTLSEDMDTQTKNDQDDEENEIVQEVSSSSEIRNIITSIKQEPLDDIEEIESIIDLESVVIKKEKLDEDYEQLLPEPVVDTTHTIVACSIDGNVELDDTSAMQVAAPSKIKINISKPVNINQSVQNKESVNLVDESSMHEDSLSQPPTASSIIPLNMVEPLQPPPPGEEPGPLHLKPRLVGKKLTELPPVSKGTELSGLCSIM